MSDMQPGVMGKTFNIPPRTLVKLKAELENQGRIEQALGAARNTVGSILFSLIDAGGGKSEKLEDYIINIETATITEKETVPSAGPGDVEK